MNKAITFFSAMLLLQGGDLIAKSPDRPLPTGSLSAPAAAFVKSRLPMLENLATGKIAQSKTTATERVATISNLDFTQGNPLLDSIRLTYSNGRGSAFDYQQMYYDITNAHDYVDPERFGTAYVNYNEAREITSGNVVIGRRFYNSASKVIKDETDTTVALFYYDGANRLSRMTTVAFNSTSGTWDSSSRETYTYNAGGYLMQDDAESWDASTGWTAAGRIEFTRDGSGRPLTAGIQLPIGGGAYYTAIQYNYSYATSLPYPSLVRVQEGLSAPPNLTDYAKDTLGYTANTLSYRDSYEWDGTSAWDLYYQERRHLNGASYPDSIFYRIWTAGAAADSGYYKVAYNANNNPLYRMDYYQKNSAPYGGARWTYEPVETAGIGTVQAEQLEFYPNPASDNIRLKGVTKGNFEIFNTAGQIVASGSILNGAMIPVQLLTPGLYIVRVQDQSGKMLQANMVRR